MRGRGGRESPARWEGSAEAPNRGGARIFSAGAAQIHVPKNANGNGRAAEDGNGRAVEDGLLHKNGGKKGSSTEDHGAGRGPNARETERLNALIDRPLDDPPLEQIKGKGKGKAGAKGARKGAGGGRRAGGDREEDPRGGREPPRSREDNNDPSGEAEDAPVVRPKENDLLRKAPPKASALKTTGISLKPGPRAKDPRQPEGGAAIGGRDAGPPHGPTNPTAGKTMLAKAASQAARSTGQAARSTGDWTNARPPPLARGGGGANGASSWGANDNVGD